MDGRTPREGDQILYILLRVYAGATTASAVHVWSHSSSPWSIGLPVCFWVHVPRMGGMGKSNYVELQFHVSEIKFLKMRFKCYVPRREYITVIYLHCSLILFIWADIFQPLGKSLPNRPGNTQDAHDNVLLRGIWPSFNSLDFDSYLFSAHEGGSSPSCPFPPQKSCRLQWCDTDHYSHDGEQVKLPSCLL